MFYPYFFCQNKDAFCHNEKYFRPSKYPALNAIDFDDFIYNFKYDNKEHIILPDTIANSAKEVVINFFSILREANQGNAMNIGCGSIGNGIAPYPIAYALLSTELQNILTYDQFLKQYENIYHINLIAIVSLSCWHKLKNSDLFLIEIETLEGNSFHYYYSYLEIKKENTQYRINSQTFHKEDFFCAAYHGWQHNAELVVEFMYHDWCNLVKKQYPTQQNKNIKKIMVDGTDSCQYMFIFLELTNGTDIMVGQYKKINNCLWNPIYIDPYECLKKNKKNE